MTIREEFANGKYFINAGGRVWTVSGEIGFHVCDPLDTAGFGAVSLPHADLVSVFTTKLR